MTFSHTLILMARRKAISSVLPPVPSGDSPSLATLNLRDEMLRHSLLGCLVVSSSLDTSSVVASVGAGDAGLGVGVILLVLSGDGSELISRLGGNTGKNSSGNLAGGGGSLDHLGGGVVDLTLLCLAIASGEEDKLGFVRVESLSVELELLLGGRGASVVNGDAHSACKGGAQTSGLKLGESEATAISDLAGVPTRGR